MTFFDPTKTNIPFIQYRKILISIGSISASTSRAASSFRSSSKSR